jgi:hypothetical protein
VWFFIFGIINNDLGFFKMNKLAEDILKIKSAVLSDDREDKIYLYIQNINEHCCPILQKIAKNRGYSYIFQLFENKTNNQLELIFDEAYHLAKLWHFK